MGYFSCAYGLFLPIYAMSVTGLSAAVAKNTAEEAAKGCWSSVRRIRSTARLLFSALGAVLSLIIFLAAKPFAIFTAGDESAWYAILMIAPSALLGCMSAVERGYYEGLQNMYPTAMSQAAEAAVKVLAGLWLSGAVIANSESVLEFFPPGTDILSVSAAAAVLGVTISTGAGLLYFLLRNAFGDGIRRQELKKTEPQPRRVIARRLIRTMLPIALGSVVTSLTSVVDLCTVMRCLGYAQERNMESLAARFGDMAREDTFPAFVYGAFTGMSLTVFNLVPSVTNMFGRSVLPCAARAWARRKTASLRDQVCSVSLAAALIAMPAGAGLYILAEPVMELLYSSHSHEAAIAAEALRSLMPGMIGLCMVSPMFSIMQAIGRADLPIKLMLAGLGVKLVLNIVLIPQPLFAVTGAGISTSVCYIMMFVMGTAGLRRQLCGSIRIWSSLAPVAYSSVMCGAAAWLALSLTEDMGAAVSLVTAVAAGAFMYVLVLRIMGYTPSLLREKLSLRM